MGGASTDGRRGGRSRPGEAVTGADALDFLVIVRQKQLVGRVREVLELFLRRRAAT